MVEILLALMPVLLIILKSVLSGKYSAEGKKKRDAYERDKEIADKDHAAKSKRLSDLVDRV